jgi:mannose-6-phosphate isomerase-like protein (cupin superfamily)
MITSHVGSCPVNHRGGQQSWLLHRSERLAVTWVEGGPDSGQELHAHPDSEQVYVIVAGAGTMTLGDEQLDVSPGTAVLVPPGYQHAIRNVGDARLIYVSATAPPFDPRNRWQ